MAATTTPSYESIRTDLARAIRSRRPGCPPGETARLLLDIDGEPTELVGLSFNGSRVIVRDRTADHAIACRFDADGLIRGSGVPIATVSTDAGFVRWIGKLGSAYWGWLHPRYRTAGDPP